MSRFRFISGFITILVLLAALFGGLAALLSQEAGAAPPCNCSDGDGSPGNPFMINDSTCLQNMSSNLSAHYALCWDIDLTGFDCGDGNGFMPIGNGTNPFTGSLDGRGFTITGLYINRSGTDYVGLFGYISTGSSVSNVSLANVNISGNQLVGGLAGVVDGGAVSNSYATGTVNGTTAVGGLVGYNCGSGMINSSHATGNVNGTGGTVGGLVGDNRNLVSNSYATGTVNGGGYNVGGLAGYNAGTVSNSYATGNVSGNAFVGGLVGDSYYGTISRSDASGNVVATLNYVGGLVGWKTYGTINNSYATGNVSGNAFVGGLVGYHDCGTVSNSYSTGYLVSSGAVGGLVANNACGTVDRCFYDKDTSGQSDDDGRGTPMNTSEMKAGATFIGAGWDFMCETANGSDDIWGINEGGADNNGYPFLSWQGFDNTIGFIIDVTQSDGGTISPDDITVNCSDDQTFNITPSGCYIVSDVLVDSVSVGAVTSYTFYDVNTSHTITATFDFGVTPYSGEGTLANPYLIEDVCQLQNMSSDLGAHYALNNSIVAVGMSGWNAGAGFEPVGYGGEDPSFTGSLDGRGYTITGLFIDRPFEDSVGLFGEIGSGGVVVNVSLEDVNITGSGDVGGLAGQNEGGTVNNSSVAGNVSGYSNVGGLVGDNSEGTVTNSYAAGYVEGYSECVGGLVGYLYDGTVNNSYATGYVEGEYASGGLVGESYYGTIFDSYASGNVSGDSDVGGLVGHNCYESTVTNSYAMGNVSGNSEVGGLVGDNCEGTVTNSYAMGNVVSADSEIGGLVGDKDDGIVISSFYDSETSGQSDTGGGEPKTTAEMKNYETFFDADWDFICESVNGPDDIWGINEDGVGNNGYPFLWWQGFTHKVTLTLTMAQNGSGTISPVAGPHTYNCSDVAVINATPAACWHFVRWTGDTGALTGAATEANNSVIMNGSVSLTATFAVNTSTITSTAGANGAIAPLGAVAVNCGWYQVFNITPDACYHIVDVVVNGSSVGAVTTYNMTNVQTNGTINATFAINTYIINASAGAHGNIAPSGNVSVNCGGNQTFIVTPDPCYHIAEVWVDGFSIPGVVPRINSFAYVNRSHNISVVFAINTSTLTYRAGAGGTINGTSPQTVNCSANGTAVTAVPNTGCNFSRWSDGVLTASRTDTNVQGNLTVTAFFIRPGGGGGGGSTAGTSVDLNILGNTVSGTVDGNGVFQGDVDAASPDGGIAVHVAGGTTALGPDGNPLTGLNISTVSSYPTPPDGRTVLAAFDFQPNGATFDPAIQITIEYDPAALPEGTDESQLVIAFYNEASGQWEYVSGTVNPETNTITFSITHFTVFGVMSAAVSSAAPSETPTPTPTPTATLEATPTAEPTIEPTPAVTPTPVHTPTAAVSSGDDGPADWVLIVLSVAVGVLLAALVGAIVIRNRKK